MPKADSGTRLRRRLTLQNLPHAIRKIERNAMRVFKSHGGELNKPVIGRICDPWHLPDNADPQALAAQRVLIDIARLRVASTPESLTSPQTLQLICLQIGWSVGEARLVSYASLINRGFKSRADRSKGADEANKVKRNKADIRNAKIVKSYNRNRCKFGSIDAMLETIRAECRENFSKRTVENALKTARDGSAKR